MTHVVDEPTASSATRPAVLTGSQWHALQALAGSLTAEQALWASGYLFALSHVGTGLVTDGPPAAETLRPQTPARTLTILYGSETGNSTTLARALAGRAAALDLSPATVKREWTSARAWLLRELS